MILHDLTLRAELPIQKPDRVFGLRATKNFEAVLSQSLQTMSSEDDTITVGDMIERSSPFVGLAITI